MAEHKVAPPADSAAEVTGLAAMGCSMAASESGRGPDANPDASDVIVGVDEWRDVITLRARATVRQTISGNNITN
jgi:hypothetical protein